MVFITRHAGKPTILQVHVFRATKFTGTVTETYVHSSHHRQMLRPKTPDADAWCVHSEEMAPQWFGVDDIPFLDMWPDDQ